MCKILVGFNMSIFLKFASFILNNNLKDQKKPKIYRILYVFSESFVFVKKPKI